MPLRLCLAFLLLAPLSACSMFDDDESEAPAAVAVQEIVAPVEEVRAVEIGRTRDGIVVTAYGLAPGLGYAAPRLEPRRGGRIAEDGFLDFDFVATAPDRGFALPRGEAAARLLRADRLIGIGAARRAAGLRVHGASGGVAVGF